MFKKLKGLYVDVVARFEKTLEPVKAAPKKVAPKKTAPTAEPFKDLPKLKKKAAAAAKKTPAKKTRKTTTK